MSRNDNSNHMLKSDRLYKAPLPHYPRGYGKMFIEHIQQAELGCDFDFLASPELPPEPEIH